MPNISLTAPNAYTSQQKDIERRRKMAELLQAQSSAPIERFSSGGIEAPISWTQGLAKLLQAYTGGKQQESLKGEETTLAAKRAEALAEALGAMPKARQETTQTPFDMASAGQDMPGEPVIPGLANQQTRMVQPTMQDNAGWLGQLAKVGPDATQMGGVMLGLQQKQDENALTREATAQNQALARETRITERIMQLDAAAQNQALSREDRAARARESADLRRELQQNQLNVTAQINAGRREDRQSEIANRREDRAREIEQKRVDKLEATQGKQDQGKARVTTNLNALNDYYSELESLGAVVDSSKTGATNLSARVRSSGIGQAVGGALGTNEQVWRGNINQMRPLLLQEIRQASAMGARGLDSNKELEFYLQAATDPTKDIKTNRAAISVLENAYGLGSIVKGADPASVAKLRSQFNSGAQSTPAPPPGFIENR